MILNRVAPPTQIDRPAIRGTRRMCDMCNLESIPISTPNSPLTSPYSVLKAKAITLKWANNIQFQSPSRPSSCPLSILSKCQPEPATATTTTTTTRAHNQMSNCHRARRTVRQADGEGGGDFQWVMCQWLALQGEKQVHCGNQCNCRRTAALETWKITREKADENDNRIAAKVSGGRESWKSLNWTANWQPHIIKY